MIDAIKMGRMTPVVQAASRFLDGEAAGVEIVAGRDDWEEEDECAS